MRIDELTRPDLRSDYKTILGTKGWKSLGSGSYGDVYGKPGVDYVLKVFNADDHAYRDYLDLIARYDNPHFPVIKGKLVKITPQIYAVRLEKLSPYRRISIDGLGLSYIIQLYLRFGDVSTSAIADAFDAYPRLRECLDLIRVNLSNHSMDVNPENVMMRGDELVITDPAS